MKTLTPSDLIVGATYDINWPGKDPWKGRAIFRGINAFPDYREGALCFDCLDPITGELDGIAGVFDIEHVVGPMSQEKTDLRKALAAIIDARDRAALADDPAYYEIDREIDNARKILELTDESS